MHCRNGQNHKDCWKTHKLQVLRYLESELQAMVSPVIKDARRVIIRVLGVARSHSSHTGLFRICEFPVSLTMRILTSFDQRETVHKVPPAMLTAEFKLDPNVASTQALFDNMER
jgi:hypothetical protein